VDLEAVHKVLTEQGVKAFTKTYGDKYVKNFRGFLAMTLKPKDEPKEVTL
jgi:hypothetical protein